MTPRNGLAQFFANPTVGVVGSIASVIGLLLAVYFYVKGGGSRELRYFPNPTRTVVARVGQTSRLTIMLDGASIKNDVSAAQIVFWNQGHEPIKPEHMLRALVIKTSPSAPILEVDIRGSTRDVVRVSLDRSRLSNGEVTVHWNILELNDGAILQIIYLGPVSTLITATATVEGQGELPQVDSWLKVTSNSDLMVFRVGGGTYIASGIFMGIFLIRRVRQMRRRWISDLPFRLRYGPWLLVLMPLVMIGLGLYWLLVLPTAVPPFEF